MTDLFYTDDVAASVRRLHGAYTHVVVNRSYKILKPIFFKTALISDLPIKMFADWEPPTAGFETWKSDGGVLLDRSCYTEKAGAHDALVLVECPMSPKELDRTITRTEKQVVIFRPPSWKTHEEAIEILNPNGDTCRKLHKGLVPMFDRAHVARVSKYPDAICVLTDRELADATDLPSHHAMWMRRVFQPQEVWGVRPRLAPDDAGLLATWNAVHEIARGQEILFARLVGGPQGWRRSLKEMARLGHIGLQRYRVYPNKEPDFDVLDAKHSHAVSALKEMRDLMASLPAHPLA